MWLIKYNTRVETVSKPVNKQSMTRIDRLTLYAKYFEEDGLLVRDGNQKPVLVENWFPGQER